MAGYAALTRAVAGLLGVFSPDAALRYMQGHERLAAIHGYNAARRDGANARWRPLDDSINARNLRDRRLIQARARQIAADSPVISGALDRVVANVVHRGIRPQCQIIGRDGELRERKNTTVEQQFAAWAERSEFYDLQGLALRHCWLDGGCLLHWYPRKDWLAEGVVPLGMELLPLDALDVAVNGPQKSGNRAFAGIEVDAYGAPAAWHVRPEALGDGLDQIMGLGNWGGISLGDSIRLPVSSCVMVSSRRRIGELLPVSWLQSVLLTMQDLDEYQTSERVAARLGAAFGVFITLPQGETGNSLNGMPRPALTGGTDTLGRIISGNEFLGQGRIDALPYGTQVQQAKNERPGTTYGPFIKSVSRAAACGLGQSYESFAADFSDSSYSSARQAVLEERRGYVMQQMVLERRLCAPLWRVWCRYRADFLSGGPDVVPVSWQAPGWSWVDPRNDAQAARMQLDMRIISRRQLCEQWGRDYDEVQRQLRREAEEAAQMGNAPQAAQDGGPQEPDAADGAPDGGQSGGQSGNDAPVQDDSKE